MRVKTPQKAWKCQNFSIFRLRRALFLPALLFIYSFVPKVGPKRLPTGPTGVTGHRNPISRKKCDILRSKKTVPTSTPHFSYRRISECPLSACNDLNSVKKICRIEKCRWGNQILCKNGVVYLGPTFGPRRLQAAQISYPYIASIF